MVNGLYISALIFLAGMLSYGVIHHCTIEHRWPQRRVHLLFAGLCLLTVLLTLSNLQTIMATTVASYIPLQRLSIALLISLFTLLPWFFTEYAGKRPMPLLAGFTGLFAVLFLVNLTQPYTLLHKEIHGLARISLPWGEEIFLPLATPSTWGYIGIAAALLVNAFGFYILSGRFRRHDKRTALAMMFAMSLLLASILQSALARLGILHLPPLGLFGSLGMLIIMGLALNHEIREERKHLQAVLDNVPAYIYMKDSKGQYIMVNRHFEDIFHVSSATVYGKTDYDIFPREQAEVLHTDDQRAIAMRTTVEQEEIANSNGELRTYYAIKVPLFYDDGAPFAVCGIATDISERKRIREALKDSVSRMKATIESTADGILVVDNLGRITDFNEQFTRLWRLPQALLNLHDDQKALDFVLDQLKDPNQFMTKVRDLYENHNLVSFDVLEFKDGRVVERYSQPQKIDGISVGRVWSFRNITERKKVEKILAKERKFLATILDTTSTLIVVLDPKGAIIRYNAACERLTGISSDHVKGRTIWDLFAITEDISIHRLAIATAKDMPFLNGYETSFRAVDGSERTVVWTNSIFCEEEGTDCCIISTGVDVTDRKALEKELIRAASIDKLTALINRQALDKVISKERERAIRYKRPLSLIMFDIDHFKRINDTYGHIVGDSVLREVASLAQANLRTNESLGRWGGEEFMVVLPETSIEGARLTAEKLRCLFEKSNFTGINELTASFGVTEYSNRENIDRFLQRVDDALYVAKQEGRSRVVCKSMPDVDESIRQ